MLKSNRPKVLMIGIDAGDINYIEDNIDHFPTLRSLTEDGVMRRMDSTAEVLEGSVWSTFHTGHMPGEHGTYFPMQWDPQNMQLDRLSRTWQTDDPFWIDLGRQDKNVIVFDVPYCFAGHMDDRVEHINWNTQENFDSPKASVSKMQREVLARFGHGTLGYDIPTDKTDRQLDDLHDLVLKSAKKRTEITRWLMDNTEWDLLISVFAECHRAGHYLWPDPDAECGQPRHQERLLDVYKFVDAQIAEIVRSADAEGTTVIVFATHGMGPNNSQAYFVPKVVDRINQHFMGHGTKIETPSGGHQGIIRQLRENVPGQIQYQLARAVPQPVRDWVINRQFTAGVDWSQVPGLVLPGGGYGFIRCNLKGREADGMMEPGGKQHQDYLRLLKDTFLDLRETKTGRQITKNVILSHEVYSGSRTDYLPDVIVLWEDDMAPALEIRSEKFGTFQGRLGTGRGGNHFSRAFAVFAGDMRGLSDQALPTHIADLSKTVRGFLAA